MHLKKELIHFWHNSFQIVDCSSNTHFMHGEAQSGCLGHLRVKEVDVFEVMKF